MKDKKPPITLDLSTSEVTDIDRVVAFQLAEQFAKAFRLPRNRAGLEPLVLAFCNGVAYARKYARMSEEERQQFNSYYEQTAKEMFDPTQRN